mmetsp:Transcript_13238/g.22062  ORF Transcript_13238/g.22062 Transcript_13238/m.22062 type:complete len:216 (+) Transcript_13238:1673-2320(+)
MIGRIRSNSSSRRVRLHWTGIVITTTAAIVTIFSLISPSPPSPFAPFAPTSSALSIVLIAFGAASSRIDAATAAVLTIRRAGTMPKHGVANGRRRSLLLASTPVAAAAGKTAQHRGGWGGNPVPVEVMTCSILREALNITVHIAQAKEAITHTLVETLSYRAWSTIQQQMAKGPRMQTLAQDLHSRYTVHGQDFDRLAGDISIAREVDLRLLSVL